MEKKKISKHIYGHFSEHLGRCIYDDFYVGEYNTKIANTQGMRMMLSSHRKKIKLSVFKQASLNNNNALKVILPAHSVVVLELK